MIVGTEVFTGLFFTATMLGLIFARMSRPRARLLFARVLTVGPHEGQPTLSVRVANARLNIMSSANARLWVLLSETTAEGTRFRRFVELPLLRSENPTFALSWTMLHRIDGSSPLYGRTADELIQDDALLVVNITGHDESSGQAVQARETYLASDVRFDHRYMDILSTSDDGQTLLDYSRFHDIEPVPAAVNAGPVTRAPQLASASRAHCFGLEFGQDVGQPGRVIAGETMIGELRPHRVALRLAHGAIDALDGEEGQRVGTHEGAHAFEIHLGRQKLVPLGCVDPVVVGMGDGRAGDAEMHLARAGVAHHLHDLHRGRAANHQIVDEDDAASLDHPAVGAVLHAHADLADGLARLDEGPARHSGCG